MISGRTEVIWFAWIHLILEGEPEDDVHKLATTFLP